MRLQHTTSFCARHMAPDTYETTWKLIATEARFPSFITDEHLALLCVSACGSPDPRVVEWLLCPSRISSRRSPRVDTVRLLDGGPFFTYSDAYAHVIVDLTGPLRRVRCRRACVILLCRLGKPQDKDVVALIARLVWRNKYDASWDRE